MSIVAIKKSLADTLAEYRRRIDQIPDDRFDATPPGGGSSYADVYAHLLQADLASFISIEKCTNGTGKIDNKGAKLLARMIFLTGTFPSLQYKTPKGNANEGTKFGKEDARNLIIKLKTRIDQLSPAINKSSTFSKISHARLGLLNAKQWLKYIDIHTKHHLKQLKHIDKKFGTV